MVEPSLRAPLVAAVGATVLLDPGVGAASRAAIALAAITVLTDPEHRVASPAAANPLTENHLALNRHPRPPAGLDNGSPSWQAKTIESGDLPKVAKPGPRRLQRRGPPVVPAFQQRPYTIGEPLG